MIRTIVRGNRYDSGLTFDDTLLAAVQPTLYVFGTAEQVGTVQTGSMPSASCGPAS
jgi:hypothetical protein